MDLNGLNYHFRNLKTYDDLTKFLNILKKEGYCLGSKKSFKVAFDFQQNINPDKVSYLFDDEVSRGKCRISNLYKYLEISE